MVVARWDGQIVMITSEGVATDRRAEAHGRGVASGRT